MTTKAKRIVNDPRQMSLLDYLKQEREERMAKAAGRLCVSARLQAAIRAAIKVAPKSRETIADEMTELVGQTVTVHQVNNWTAESHPHRMPAELLPAFCEAAGVFTLPGADALRAELQKLDEEAKRIAAEKRKRMLFLRELEG